MARGKPPTSQTAFTSPVPSNQTRPATVQHPQSENTLDGQTSHRTVRPKQRCFPQAIATKIVPTPLSPLLLLTPLLFTLRTVNLPPLSCPHKSSKQLSPSSECRQVLYTARKKRPTTTDTSGTRSGKWQHTKKDIKKKKKNAFPKRERRHIFSQPR